MNVCSKRVCLEVSWVDFECFHAILWRSRWLLNRFSGNFWPPLFIYLFEPFFDSIWVLWKSIRGHLGIILASFWGRFEATFGPFLGHFHGHFANFRWCFGKLTATLSKMMRERAKICKFLPAFTKKMQNCAKTSFFSATKHLFCLKTQSKSTFQPMKVCSKWVCLDVSWVDFEWFYLGSYRVILVSFWNQNRTIWGDFGPFSGRPAVISGSLLGSFWHHFVVVLVSFWPHFEAISGPFWAIFWTIFEPF